jgi:dolichol-phosphate mannosyltransferase
MYNEEKVVKIFFSTINDVIASIHDYQFELIVVNDGSKDQTLTLLYDQFKIQSNLIVVNLSRNFGHEPAVAAGIKVAKGDAIIPMDADLQDPPSLIKELLKKFEEGFDVVNAKRKSRHEDSFFKRFSAIKFYQFIAKLSGKVKIPQNVGHFRLISRRVANEVIALSERNRVFRIQVPYIGFKTTEVFFDRPKRAAGETHYNLKSMLKLAVDSIASTTSVPLVWPLTVAIIMGFISTLSIL